MNLRIYEFKNKGFTFIELLVSVTIMAVMMAVAIVSYSSTNVRSRDTKRKADMETIRSALEICRSNTGEYPAVIYNSVVCSDTTVTLQNTPTDPKPPAVYVYTPLTTTTYTLTCTLELAGTCSYSNP
ncbi:prepilin-type N-terminal cleavage/methylation domain-containing protein [Candidatus Collierbacteria bacterium]|nr:prepilin-type N-terminal cleavage/methylation domain-containing protein [Candidatus Collierbacteria bacterium]